MLVLQRRCNGISLVEVMVALAILAILTSLALPSYTAYLRNQAIRSTAESLLVAAQTARGESIRSNNTVVMQVVDSLDNGCSADTSGRYWVVSHCAAAGHCGDPIDKQSGLPDAGCAGGTPLILAKGTFDTDGKAQLDLNNSALCYSSLGRINPTASNCPQGTLDPINQPGGMISVNITHQDDSCITEGGSVRCLRLDIGMGGEPHLCDPSISNAGDPRKC